MGRFLSNLARMGIQPLDQRLFDDRIRDGYLQAQRSWFTHRLRRSGSYELWQHDAPSQTLRALFDTYGSDKGSMRVSGHPYPWPPHTYADVYANLFDHCRDSVRCVVECGIGTNNENISSNMSASGMPGASLRAWRDYFPRAQIVGGDIDEAVLFSDDRIRTFHLDQRDPESIRVFWGVIGDTPVDLFVDDGLHTFEAGLSLLFNSWGAIAPGCLYVIEDVSNRNMARYRRVLARAGPWVSYVWMPGTGHRAPHDNNLIILRRGR